MKDKITSLCFKAQCGNNRNVIVNGTEHHFSVYMNVKDVIKKLETSYELTNADKREIEMLW